MGVALGCIRLSFDDFCKLDYDEFTSVCTAWHDHAEEADRSAWERMRVLAAISIQPHVKKAITPKKLLPLPWDGKRRKTDQPILTKEESKKRYFDLLQRLGEKPD